MGKGGSAKQEVNEYRMSIHFGLCTEADAITGIYIGEKEAWSGDVSTETAIGINRPDLFGGIKKEGGVSGIAYYLPGGPTQKLPNGLAARRGLTADTHPAYRGLSSIYFVGTVNAGVTPGYGFGASLSPGYGFMWGATPYMQSVWFRMRRAPKGLNPDYALIGPDANPAHIIYECLTNTSWGMGATDDIIDRAGFEAVAIVLHAELFGLTIFWTKETTIQAFIAEVLDHIQAALYVDPETGKLSLKLFRGDYVVDSLPEINPDNADLDNYQRKLWGETVNEISVSWTNPTNEQLETVTHQDLGNITLQGGTVSTSRNYYGVRNPTLAGKLAARDVRQSAAPLASVDAKLDRTMWNLKPGSVVKLTWPEYEIFDLVMRVMNIDYGKIGNPEITVSLLEDIFAMDGGDHAAAPGTGWIDPSQDPEPLDRARIITAPLFFTSRRLQAGDAAVLDYPEVMTAVLAATTQQDANFYELVGQTVLPNGDSVAEGLGTRALLGFTHLTAPLVAEPTTTISTFPVIVGGQEPTVSGFLFIGDAGEKIMEIAMIQSYDTTVGWTLRRGVLDTVPRAWSEGTSVWFYDIRNEFFDPDIHADTEVVRYKLQTITSRGTLAIEATPITAAAMTARPYLPIRPANVTVGGVNFGSVDLSGTPPTTVPVTWATRNRLFESGTVVPWGDSSVTPETGQTVTIRLTKTDGTALTSHTGLTGTSFAIPIASFAGEIDADVTVLSVRDGFESLQGLTIRVRVATSGSPIGDAPPPDDPDPDPGEDFPDPWEPPHGRNPNMPEL